MTWFSTPEAQPEPHYWAATLAGHALLGLGAGALALIFLGPLAAFSAPLVYTVLWEGLQFLMSGRKRVLLWDCLLDAVGFALGALAGFALWTHDATLFLPCAGSLGAVAAAGVVRRSK